MLCDAPAHRLAAARALLRVRPTQAANCRPFLNCRGSTNLSKITSSANPSSWSGVQSVDRFAELAEKSRTEQIAGGLLCRPPVRQGRLNLPASGVRQTNAIDPL